MKLVGHALKPEGLFTYQLHIPVDFFNIVVYYLYLRSKTSDCSELLKLPILSLQ